MRLKLIACEVLYRELCAAVARSVNQVDLEFLPKGLHDKGVARNRFCGVRLSSRPPGFGPARGSLQCLWARRPDNHAAEREAYGGSDTISPRYLWQRCGRFSN